MSVVIPADGLQSPLRGSTGLIRPKGANPHLARPCKRAELSQGRSAADPKTQLLDLCEPLATAESRVPLPGIVAHPPFSMIDRRSHEETFLNSTNFVSASACWWNLSTQIGASAATTAGAAKRPSEQ